MANRTTARELCTTQAHSAVTHFLPRIDATSLLSLLLVFAATATLPPRVRLALLGSELLFAASSAVRYRRHNAPTSTSPSPTSTQSTTSQLTSRKRLATQCTARRQTSLPTLQTPKQHPSHCQSNQLQQTQIEIQNQSLTQISNAVGAQVSSGRRIPLLWVRRGMKRPLPQQHQHPHQHQQHEERDLHPRDAQMPNAPSVQVDGEAVYTVSQLAAFLDVDRHLDTAARAELLASRLLDRTEGHLQLLQGGHLLAQWFNGLSGPHQLHLTHVTQLLAYLLLPPQPPPQPSHVVLKPPPIQLPFPIPMPSSPSSMTAPHDVPYTDRPNDHDVVVNGGGVFLPQAGEPPSIMHVSVTHGSAAAAALPNQQPDIEALAWRLMKLLEVPTAADVVAEEGAEATDGSPPASDAHTEPVGGGGGDRSLGPGHVCDGGTPSGRASAAGGLGPELNRELDLPKHGAGGSTDTAAPPATSSSMTSISTRNSKGVDVGGATAVLMTARVGGTAAAVAVTTSSPATASATDHTGPAAGPRPSPTLAPAPAVRLLAATTDPLVTSYRPLAFYMLTEAVAGATHLVLLGLLGFRVAGVTPAGTAIVYEWQPRPARRRRPRVAAHIAHQTATDTATTHGTPISATFAPSSGEEGRFNATSGANDADSDLNPEPDSEPVVFLHGIGLGLTPYLRMIGRLVAASGRRRRVFAVQYKHVSMRLTATIPAPQEVARDVAALLASKGVRRMSLCAHSYGTLVASALTKLAAACPRAPAVSRLTLVDPVCFAMFLPHLVRNAIYQQPVAAPQQQQQKHHQQQQQQQTRTQPAGNNMQTHAGASVAAHWRRRNSVSTAAASTGRVIGGGVWKWRLVGPDRRFKEVEKPTGTAVSAGSVSDAGRDGGRLGGGGGAEGLGPQWAAQQEGNHHDHQQQQKQNHHHHHNNNNHLQQQQPQHQSGMTGSSSQKAGPGARLRHVLSRHLLRGLVVAEFHCSVALRRRLDWAAVNLWPSELPPDTTVVLAGRDNLVPVREVRNILATRAALLGPSARHPTVLFHEDLGHGGFLAHPAVQEQVLAAVLGVSEQAVQTALRAEAEEGQAPRKTPAPAGGGALNRGDMSTAAAYPNGPGNFRWRSRGRRGGGHGDGYGDALHSAATGDDLSGGEVATAQLPTQSPFSSPRSPRPLLQLLPLLPLHLMALMRSLPLLPLRAVGAPLWQQQCTAVQDSQLRQGGHPGCRPEVAPQPDRPQSTSCSSTSCSSTCSSSSCSSSSVSPLTAHAAPCAISLPADCCLCGTLVDTVCSDNQGVGGCLEETAASNATAPTTTTTVTPEDVEASKFGSLPPALSHQLTSSAISSASDFAVANGAHEAAGTAALGAIDHPTGGGMTVKNRVIMSSRTRNRTEESVRNGGGGGARDSPRSPAAGAVRSAGDGGGGDGPARALPRWRTAGLLRHLPTSPLRRIMRNIRGL